MSIEQLPHVCECEECRTWHDQKIAEAFKLGDSLYESAFKPVKHECVIIPFPVWRRFVNGER
jgi:predicted anti-sigma-YlaC factor YlaD